MAYAGYNAWSVVFGEQPSAAKWNLLGTNDAEFATKAVQCIDRQDNVANSNFINPREQIGWGWIQGDGVNYTLNEAVTFPVAYDSVPVVIISVPGGLNGADPTAIGDFNGAGAHDAKCYSITVNGFQANVQSSDGATALNAVVRYGYAWHSIGPIA